MKKTHEYYDIVIIGGGPAGLTAAIYTGRAKLKTLVIEKALIGGLATYTSEVINYPGFPQGITGTGLMDLFHSQAKAFGVSFKLTDVKDVNFSAEADHQIETFRTIYHAKAVIIASGGKPRLTNAENEEKFLFDRGISFCATCDAAACEDKTVLVVGSGDSALEEAVFLSKFAKKIFIAVRKDKAQLKAGKAIQSEAENNSRIIFMWNRAISSFNGDDCIKSVILENTLTHSSEELFIDRCFLFIGYEPDTGIFDGQISRTKHGYIPTDDRLRTNIAGVFAVGDVREKSVRQIATAVGDGAAAAVEAGRYIDRLHS